MTSRILASVHEQEPVKNWSRRTLIYSTVLHIWTCPRSVTRVMYRSNRSFNIPPAPRHPPGIWHLFPGEEGIWLSESSSRGWGIWSPCVRGGEYLNCTLDLVWNLEISKSLARRAVMRDVVLEHVGDFRGKDCAFMANWLQGLCRIWRYLNFNIFNIGFRLWIYLPAIQCNNKKLNRGQLHTLSWCSSNK